MNKICGLIFLILTTVSCKTITSIKNLDSSNLITKVESYELINLVLKNHNSTPFLNVVDRSMIPYDIKIPVLESIFDKGDLAYVEAQLKSSSSFKLEQEMLKDKVLINRDSLESYKVGTNEIQKLVNFWKEYNMRHKAGFYNVNAPIFSKDKKTAIIQYAYSCGGQCGDYIVAVYKKQDNRWIFQRWIAFSIS